MAILLVISAPRPGCADVYVHRDAAGIEHFTNQAPDDRYRRISELLVEQPIANRAGSPPAAPRSFAAYDPHVAAVAEEQGVDKALVHAIITAESGYNPSAVSRAGALGLMQLMPSTARRYNVEDVFDPQQNIRGGTRYLRDLLALFQGDVTLAVAAYNAGENAVLRHGKRIPPYRETRAYVPKVLGLYSKYKLIL